MTGLWVMSDKELSRFEVLQRVLDRRMTQQGAMKRSKLWLTSILIVSAILLSGASPSPQPSPVPGPRPSTKSQTKQSEGRNRNTERNRTPSPEQTAPVKIGPARSLQNVTAYGREQGDQKEENYRLTDILLTLFNGLLALFTLLLVIVGGLQARRLRQTVEATKETADAAKKSADTAQRALTVLEVPYVSIGEIVPHVFRIEDGKRMIHSPNFPMTFEFSLTNHGRTLAEVVAIHCEVRIYDVLPTTPEYSSSVESSGDFAIGPNSDTGKVRWFATYQCPTNKVVDEFESLLGSASRRLVCFGYVDYRDSFKTNWRNGFAWAWYPYSDSVFFVGGGAYNYNRKRG
jgi:hypothetical protein